MPCTHDTTGRERGVLHIPTSTCTMHGVSLGMGISSVPDVMPSCTS